LSLPYFDFIVAFLAAESGSFADFFTGKNCHIILQFFSANARPATNEPYPTIFALDHQTLNPRRL
jgi:hypothetical protein